MNKFLDGACHLDPSTRYKLQRSVLVTQLFPPYPPGTVGFRMKNHGVDDLMVSPMDAVKVRAMIAANPDKKMGVSYEGDKIRLHAIDPDTPAGRYKL